MTVPSNTIIVTGPPRSGTSLLMQMLVAARVEAITDGRRVQDPDNPRGYFEHDQVMRLAHDQSVFEDSAGKAVKVIHALLKYIPAEIPLAALFLERDLEEVLASQTAMLQRLGLPQTNLDPQRMCELLASQLSAARRELRIRPDTTVLDVQYHRLIADPAAAADQIAAFLEPVLGKSLDAKAMAACVDRSLYRQRRGRG